MSDTIRKMTLEQFHKERRGNELFEYCDMDGLQVLIHCNVVLIRTSKVDKIGRKRTVESRIELSVLEECIKAYKERK